MEQITIVGAGLAGVLLSALLAKKGYKVQLFDARKSPRSEKKDAERSINLAMSCRGLTALQSAGLKSILEDKLVPMRSRAIHLSSGEILYQSFGRSTTECIYAIRRRDLHLALLDFAESFKNVECFFEHQLRDIDFKNKELLFELPGNDKKRRPYQRLIGADGAGSVVRDCMEKNHKLHSKRIFLSHGYKELSITLKPGIFEKGHLHLWPRENFLLLGNPNPDESITGSLFLPYMGKTSFNTLENKNKVASFFKNEFPDVYASTPSIVEEFLRHPVGRMSSIHSGPWYDGDDCCLIGDAAHGIIPFFGQGMNAAFEDCRIFDEILSKHGENWELVFKEFYESRKKNTEAVSRMSIDNYHEIQEGIQDKTFNLKKDLNHQMMERFPKRYISKHVLVMFTNTPYHTAEEIGVLQDKMLQDLCENVETLKEIDWEKAEHLMQTYDKKLTELNNHH